LKSIVAQFDAAELITQREVVGHFTFLPLPVTNDFGRYLHAFVRICLHVRENSISSSRTYLSHISRLERYGFIDSFTGESLPLCRNSHKLSRRSRLPNRVSFAMLLLIPCAQMLAVDAERAKFIVEKVRDNRVGKRSKN
jgi:hypothetical protein